MAKKKDLTETIESELAKMLASDVEPNEQRMKLLKLGIGFVAVKAKLEETEYGGFFNDADEQPERNGRGKKRTKSGTRGDEADDAGSGDTLARGSDEEGLALGEGTRTH